MHTHIQTFVYKAVTLWCACGSYTCVSCLYTSEGWTSALCILSRARVKQKEKRDCQQQGQRIHHLSSTSLVSSDTSQNRGPHTNRQVTFTLVLYHLVVHKTSSLMSSRSSDSHVIGCVYTQVCTVQLSSTLITHDTTPLVTIW